MKKTTLLLLLGTVFIAQTQSQNLSPFVGGDMIAPLNGAIFQMGQVQAGSMMDNCMACDSAGMGFMDHHDESWGDSSSSGQDCGCHNCINRGSGTVAVRTVAAGAIVIPAQILETTCDCVTTGSNTTTGTSDENAHKHEQFCVQGNLRTNSFQCQHGQELADTNWCEEGENDCHFHELHSVDSPIKPGCHTPHRFPEESSSDSDDEAVRDIEERINKQIDKALSEILSNAVEKCISSALKDCIEI